MSSDKEKKKAEKLITKGDKLLAKGSSKKALGKYKKAKDLDPERADVYDKLVDAHDKATDEWEASDIVESVSWTMEKQEVENPLIKLTHAMLNPDAQEVSEKINGLFQAETREEEADLVDEIHKHGESAVYPLLHTLIQIKDKLTQPKSEEQETCQQKEE